MEEFRAWQKAANGLLNKIALAPEREGVEEFVQTITGEGVTVALGHSNATFEEAKKAVDAGEAAHGVTTFCLCEKSRYDGP